MVSVSTLFLAVPYARKTCLIMLVAAVTVTLTNGLFILTFPVVHSAKKVKNVLTTVNNYKNNYSILQDTLHLLICCI